MLTSSDFVPGSRVRFISRPHAMRARVMHGGKNVAYVDMQQNAPRGFISLSDEAGNQMGGTDQYPFVAIDLIEPITTYTD